jgi:hypothetical protein
MPLLYRQYAISLDRPRFQLFGSLHLVVDGSNSNGRLRLPQECNEQMRVMERRVETTRKGGWREDGLGPMGFSVSLPQCRECG